MDVGRKIYFEKATGNILVDTGERNGDVVETTIDQDFQSYISLQERVRDSVGVIQLNYGEYAQDFIECSGYKIDITTNKLVFSYPYPNNPTAPQEPVYQKPLTEQVEELKQSIAELSMLLATPV